MNSKNSLLRSTVMKKYIVALSGLAIVGFLVAHLAGNLLLYSGPAAFNKYAQGLRDLGPLLWMLRGGMIVVFVAHIYFTIQLKSLNSAARPNDYQLKAHHSSTVYSRSMFLTGLSILTFTLFHLAHFTLGYVQPAAYGGTWIMLDGRTVHDAYKMVIAGFHVSWMSAIYILSVSVVFMHLQHAVQSAFQTLGFSHPKYTPLVLRLSAILATILWLGFVSIPISVLAGVVQ